VLTLVLKSNHFFSVNFGVKVKVSGTMVNAMFTSGVIAAIYLASQNKFPISRLRNCILNLTYHNMTLCARIFSCLMKLIKLKHLIITFYSRLNL